MRRAHPGFMQTRKGKIPAKRIAFGHNPLALQLRLVRQAAKQQS